MNDLAIRAQGLGKRYRIGVRQAATAKTGAWLKDIILSPFAYLRASLREPTEEETLWAVRDVSFEVRQGEVLGIVGRNGAGKSTLLKILSQVTEPSTGQAEIFGRVGSLLEVGTGFHPDLTGRENVFMNGAILGMTKTEIDRKFDEILEFADIERFIDTPVKRYSSGMAVRLAFAVAAHLEPEILIVDEVLAVGDAAFQKKCLGKMESIAGEGRTVLFVSHNMPAVTRLCTRAILLERGRLSVDGLPADVVATYLDAAKNGGAGQVWSMDTAPGTEEFKLLSINVLSNDGHPVVVADIAEPFRLELQYQVLKPGLSFRCAAKFFTQGVCAFVTIEPTEIQHPRAGVYCSSVIIPAHLLSEGEYTIGISIFASRGRKIHFVNKNDLIAFQVVDHMTSTSARGDYMEAMAGVMRPLLQWKLDYAEN